MPNTFVAYEGITMMAIPSLRCSAVSRVGATDIHSARPLVSRGKYPKRYASFFRGAPEGSASGAGRVTMRHSPPLYLSALGQTSAQRSRAGRTSHIDGASIPQGSLLMSASASRVSPSGAPGRGLRSGRQDAPGQSRGAAGSAASVTLAPRHWRDARSGSRRRQDSSRG